MFKTVRATTLAILRIAALATAAVPTAVQDCDDGYHLLEERVVTGRWPLPALRRSDCHLCNEEIDETMRFHREKPNIGW